MREKLKRTPSAVTYLQSQQWAIIPEALSDILSHIKEDITAFFDVGESAKTPFKRNGSVAEIHVNGPIFDRSNILTLLGMGTSIENIDAQFDEALRDNDIKEISFFFNTPGGMFTPSSKFAEKLYLANQQPSAKKTTAIITGVCASAGYHLASTCHKIMATDDTNLIGSIGVILPVARKDDETIDFISSNAPYKNPDPTTQTGRDVYQGIVDRLESVMIEKIARNRGVTAAFVKENFGKGNVLLAKEALTSKMIDNLKDFGGNMDKATLKKDFKATYDEIIAEGVASVDTKALTDEVVSLKATIDTLTKERDALQAKLTPIEPSAEVKALIAKTEALEKEVLSAKLTGVLDDVKADLTSLYGKAEISIIEKIGGHFKALQAKINALGAPQGELSGEGDAVEAAIKAEVDKLVAAGMSRTDAITEAYKKLTK